MFRFFVIFLITLTASVSNAERFSVEENTIYFLEALDTEGEILNDEDVRSLENLLRENPDIDTLNLHSFGGYVSSGKAMARVVIDFNLDTVVSHTCQSSCILVFLAGNNRKLERGGNLGFHRSVWSAADMEEYYNEQKDSKGWGTPFDFGVFLHEDTQKDTYEELLYMLDRGVTAAFAVRSLQKSNEDMWFPYREELLNAGVITE